MSYYVANQTQFDSIMSGSHEDIQSISRCRCQPNTCSRPVCRGCVDCLGRRAPENTSGDKMLIDFFAE